MIADFLGEDYDLDRLREQVERMRGEWNYSHKTKIDGFDVVQCSKCGQEALTLALYVKNGNFAPIAVFP